MHGLGERAVSRRIPGSEPDPLLAAGVERNAESMSAERPDVRGRDDLAFGLVAVAPYQFHELRRKCPLYLGIVGARRACALDAVAAEEDFSARNIEVAGAHGFQDRGPVLV